MWAHPQRRGNEVCVVPWMPPKSPVWRDGGSSCPAAGGQVPAPRGVPDVNKRWRRASGQGVCKKGSKRRKTQRWEATPLRRQGAWGAGPAASGAPHLAYVCACVRVWSMCICVWCRGVCVKGWCMCSMCVSVCGVGVCVCVGI